MSLYKSLGNAIRKCLFLTVLSAAAICGGCDKDNKEENLVLSLDYQAGNPKALKAQKRELEAKYFGFGGYGNEKEHGPERELESKVRMYDYLSNKAENSFKRFIADKLFKEHEQRNVLCDLRIREDLRKEIAELPKFTYASPLPTSNTLKMIYHALEENQRGLDLGTPELEKILHQAGIDVKVEKHLSLGEMQTYALFLVGLLVMGGIYVSRKKEEGKKDGWFDPKF